MNNKKLSQYKKWKSLKSDNKIKSDHVSFIHTVTSPQWAKQRWRSLRGRIGPWSEQNHRITVYRRQWQNIWFRWIIIRLSWRSVWASLSLVIFSSVAFCFSSDVSTYRSKATPRWFEHFSTLSSLLAPPELWAENRLVFLMTEDVF